MKLLPRLDREEKVQMKAGQKIQWKLDLPYSYLGMDYASVLASLFSVGMDPSDAGYFVLTVIEGVTFLQLHPIVDMGVAVKSFGYSYDGGDSRWSLISFGPAFRAGRLVVKSFLGMLSFNGGGWAPGFSFRATIPFFSEREAGLAEAFIPIPSVGLDVHLDGSLGYDSTRFWVGFELIGGVDFL
jgi:hypothetical protein